MIYTTCKYAPEELFAGFDRETKRLDPNPRSFSCADGCSHPNLCGFAKAVIEEVNEKEIRELIFTDCCDAMRRTFDVLQEQKPDFFYFLPLPHKTGEPEIRMFAGELQNLAAAYASYCGKAFSWEKAFAACKAAQNRAAEKSSGERYISLCGAHGGSMLLQKIKESFPNLPVRDDTCSGNRRFAEIPEMQEPESEAEFFLWYARRLLQGMTPCMRMKDTRLREAERNAPGQKGIIYHTIKFCDYYSFEYLDLRNAAKVPLLKIETDTTPQSSGQLKTRIEAFAETLGVSGLEKKARRGNTEHMHIAGIDSGSTSTDVVIMNEKQEILGSAILPTGMSASKSAKEALDAALKDAGLERGELDEIVATGYGRDSIDMEKRTITEITCHAMGAHFLFPSVRTIIDIGGQDSKVIRIDEAGNVVNFIMNDKCAAGTGRFLEMQARALGLSMPEMSRIGLDWKKEVQISNMCTVFAESEVVSLVAQDTDIADIVHGLNESVAAKTISLVRRGKGESAYAMTGGVSNNEGVVDSLEKRLGSKLYISKKSQLCGAIGAALLGMRLWLDSTPK